MKNLITVLAILLVTFSNAVLAEDATYLCVAEDSTGFKFEDGAWKVAHFNVDDEKYILRKFREGESQKPQDPEPYRVFTFGNPNPHQVCEVDGFGFQGYIICRGFNGEFIFKRKTGRFLLTFTLGYVEGDYVESEYTPNITRGKCSEI